MNKIVVIIAVAMMTAMNVNAQNENLRHEVSLSYGLGSIAQFGDGLGEAGIGEQGFLLAGIRYKF